MMFYFWLGADAVEWNQIWEDYEGDWDAYTENEEMTRLGY